MGALSYKGYVANVDFDVETAQLVGRVANAREAMEFRAKSGDEVLGRFHAIIDDYGLTTGCAHAVDEYRAQQRIDAPLVVVDRQTVYWRKS